ncbi:MAG TPA: hypothetical protein PK239_11245 [Chitinophagales bacterium]|nr:hypothetical protein [Chitinophagales bacterium]HRK27843.1 hypothetical protein [Chitinophagales bacterium]
MRVAYIVLFLLIIGILGSIYAYRMTQTLSYKNGNGAMPTVNADSYAYDKLYGNRQPGNNTPADTLQNAPAPADTTNQNAGSGE